MDSELLKQMRQDFETAYNNNKRIQRYLKLVREHKSDYKTADLYAMEVGGIREQVILSYLPDLSPAEFEKIATQVILPQLKDNHEIAADFAVEVQSILNEKARIGLKAKRPEFNADKANGLIQKFSAAETVEEANSVINQNITTFTKGIISDAIYDNAQLHYDVGLDPVIKRIPFSGCCKWCTDLGGVYKYSEVKNKGNDVYRFHANCRCHIIYDPQDGSRKINTKTQRQV